MEYKAKHITQRMQRNASEYWDKPMLEIECDLGHFTASGMSTLAKMLLDAGGCPRDTLCSFWMREKGPMVSLLPKTLEDWAK